MSVGFDRISSNEHFRGEDTTSPEIADVRAANCREAYTKIPVNWHMPLFLSAMLGLTCTR